jgi:hypothetical protein
MAGGLRALAQRATVYHHLFAASGRNHVFPLIAAHGALWAGGYFRFGSKLGNWLSLATPSRRPALLTGLDAFADAFRDINRRVCVDTYASFHFTATHGEHPDALQFVAAAKLEALNRMHHARQLGVELSPRDKLRAFEAFFRSEQATVVGPSVARAAEEFDWPLMKFIALKPLLKFSYFPRGQWLWFRDFSNRDERIANGLKAFEFALQAGLNTVEERLADYEILPRQFFASPATHFESLRASVLTH